MNLYFVHVIILISCLLIKSSYERVKVIHIMLKVIEDEQPSAVRFSHQHQGGTKFSFTPYKNLI